MDIKPLAFLLMTTVALVGCAASTKTMSVDKPIDEPTVQLAEAANAISHSLGELSLIEQANTPPSTYKPLVDPAQMNDSVSIDWSGPVEPLLDRISTMSGYRLRVLGVRPAVPIIVTLIAKNTPLSDIVRDIDFQSDKKAKLFIYPYKRTIELRYAG